MTTNSYGVLTSGFVLISCFITYSIYFYIFEVADMYVSFFCLSSQPNGTPFQHRHNYRGRDRGRGIGVICCLHLHFKSWVSGC